MTALSPLLMLVAVVFGIVSAIIPLGPVTVLTIGKALAGNFRSALRIGLGRAPAEAMYCMMAWFGVVALLERFPGVRFGIEAFGTVVFLIVGSWLMLHKPKPPPPADATASQVSERALRWGDASGLIISTLNPTFLLSWSAAVGIGVSMLDYQPTLFDKIAFPLSLASGLAIGYVTLVALLRRWGARIEQAIVRRVIQTMGLVFVVVALRNGAKLLGWL